jgi:hypothetical protein
MPREIELTDETVLSINEFADLDNDAGAVVWDGALTLIHYLGMCRGLPGLSQRFIRV